ncbi:hypothetical protein N7509_007684 [Penicillium cosmopolitanum]|uniref:Secreted LysM effector LysM C-terminal domain-containing protein n=1 Tax=Penicillium cosmopolitanum TaxID=1131564 RepID=A0A9X0B8L3_9EURO|nr:uncharacterized protein N7509_007684 [Penicillium cosmopolitanum]KAJ5392194.1 hypothetical protein N7509_007684 [Penicillium cosmopolitanum]
MRVSATIGATLALCTATLAWDISFYTDSSCAQDNGDYVTYSGSQGGNCQWLGAQPPSWAKCSKFTNGGVNGPFDCTGDDFTDAKSFAIGSGNFYLADARSANSGNCQTGFGSSQIGCQSIHVRGFTPN